MKGRPKLSAGIPIGLAPVTLERKLQQTSIRTDKSGSKSHAEEETTNGRFLLEPIVEPQEGDVLVFEGRSYRLIVVFPQHDMLGTINHYQVDAAEWVSK